MSSVIVLWISIVYHVLQKNAIDFFDFVHLYKKRRQNMVTLQFRQAFFAQVVPLDVSVNTIPFSNSSPRMRSALA